MKKKISIVTPSFNQGEYLEETIDSVLSQKYPNLEYIIMDGGSKDNSVDIIKKYEKYLTYWESKPDRGQSHAINKGLKKCNGEIFNWLCSDDYLEPGALDVINSCFNKDTRLVSGKFKSINSKFYENSESIKGVFLYDKVTKSIALSSMTQPATFFKLEDIKHFGGISENLHYFMDLELLIKFLLYNGQNKIKEIDDVLVNYRVHEESKTYKEMDNSKINFESKFTQDKILIFKSIAKQIENFKAYEYLNKIYSGSIKDYNFNINDLAFNKEIITNSLNFYLFDISVKLFYAKRYKESHECANNVQFDLLTKKELKDLKYIKRNSLIRNITKLK